MTPKRKSLMMIIYCEFDATLPETDPGLWPPTQRKRSARGRQHNTNYITIPF